MGPYFLSMILIVLLGSLTLMLIYRKSFGELIYPEKVISREGSVFFTLIILVLITLSILSGTLLPTLTNGRFSAPTQWFNQVVGPQLGALVFLMGVCPLLGRYGRQIRESIWKGLPPILGLLLTPLVGYLLGFDKSIALIGFALAGFAGGTAKGEVIFNISARMRNKGGVSGIKKLPITVKQGYGGQLVHFGVVLMAIGVIGTQMFSSGTNITLSPGEMFEVQDYTLVYNDLSQDFQEDVYKTSALISVYRKSQLLDYLEPQLIYYVDYDQTIAEPVIRAGIVEDLYIVLFQWFSSGVVNLNVTINPLSSFLWFGGLLLMVGGFLAWWPSTSGKSGDHPKKIDRNNVLGLLFVFFVVVVLIFSFWGGILNPKNRSGRLLPGQTAPSISAVDINGQVFSLEEHTGKTVVVHFWATWCAECEDELRMIEKVWGEVDQQKFAFVGIAMNDTNSDVAAMSSQIDLSFPLIADPDGMICDAYGISAVPETIIIGPTGEVVEFFIGAINEEKLKQALFPAQ
jgi:cytochrome c-type biogenesis protein CcmF